MVKPMNRMRRLVLLGALLSLLLAGCADSTPRAAELIDSAETGGDSAMQPSDLRATISLPKPPTATSSPAAPSATSAPAPPTAEPATPTAPATEMPSPTAAPQGSVPLDEYVAAMRPAFAGDIEAHADLPRYMIDLEFNVQQALLHGSQELVFTNRGGGALHDVVLRLYPNFPRDAFGNGGDVRMDILAASVDDQPVEFRYLAERTAVTLPLPRLLQPGETAILKLDFTATVKPDSDGSYPLASYYPMLAVDRGEGWRLDVTDFPDEVFSESALYAVEISVPNDLTVVGTGTTVETRQEQDGRTRYSLRSGPVRNFAFSVGNFITEQQQAGEVLINVHTVRGRRTDASQVAAVAAAALTNFEQRFGPYPYRELDLQMIPFQFDGGEEYPGMILLYHDGGLDAGLRFVTAHEVAHQWWYGLVGNDILREAWLDEAFAQYSGIIYAEDVVGAAAAQRDWEREVMSRYRRAQAEGDLPVGLPIDRYPNFNVYYRAVYGKGAYFLRLVRETIGDEAFFAALQRYFKEQRYAVGSTTAVRQAFEDASGQDLGPLFRKWVTGQ